MFKRTNQSVTEVVKVLDHDLRYDTLVIHR